MNMVNYKRLLLLVVIAASATFSGCGNKKRQPQITQATVDSLKAQIKQLTAGNDMITKNLTTFDALDFTVFSNQDWARLHESHAKEVKVNWPDGHTTIGLERHIED